MKQDAEEDAEEDCVVNVDAPRWGGRRKRPAALVDDLNEPTTNTKSIANNK